MAADTSSTADMMIWDIPGRVSEKPTDECEPGPTDGGTRSQASTLGGVTGINPDNVP